MLDDDNVISTSVSEAVEKIPTDKKDYRKCSFMCFTLFSHSMQRADQHINMEIVVYLRMHPVKLKKSQKIFYITLTQKKVQ